MTPANVPVSDPAQGRSLLRYPASGTDLGAVPFADGGMADIRTYPIAERHEDIVSLAEAPGHELGWTAALRDAEDDIVLFLRDAAVLPCTSLWMSNGGRNFAPWNGRHTRVLGLEDTRSSGIGPNPWREAGVPTSFELSTNPVLRYAIGAVARPAGWTRVADVALSGDTLTLTDVGGATLALPFSRDLVFGA
jgi:hypothetical protein